MMNREESLAVFILLLLICFCCKSDDQLTRARPLGPTDIFISTNGVFALGFFSPAASTTNRTVLYVGIWFHNLSSHDPSRTIVWVANRDSPVTAASSPTLAISNSSDNLVLSNSQGRILWTTQNVVTTATEGTTAVLLGTGNLVLRSPRGTVIWQSFDHPTDTILSGMRFLLVHRSAAAAGSGAPWLVAWKGHDDPSSSDFSFGMDHGSNLLLAVWRGGQPYCRINVMNAGVSVSGGVYPSRSSGTIVYQTIVGMGDEFFLSYTSSDGSPYSRIVLDHTGAMLLLTWSSNSSSWAVVSKRPSDDGYGAYGSCGPNGYSDFTGAAPACRCLDGFEPSGLNASRDGCRRMEPLQCSQGSHFVAMPGMRVPDDFVFLGNTSFEQCVAKCSHNCSCTAYAYANLSGVGAMGSRCLVWTGELIDTWKTSNHGEQLYLRLGDPAAQKKADLVKILLPVMACLLLPTCIALFLICKFREKWRRKEIQKKLMLGYLNASSELGEQNVEFPFVSFTDIVDATDNFSDSNILGKGGFGIVYKGMLEGGKEVAIKRLSQGSGSGQGIEEFRNEVHLLVKLQHRNLVRLLGCCIHDDEKLLIYEYLPNRSLDAFLFDASRKNVLDWSTRFKIIKGVARGLLYLHQDSRLTIIHRDLKPSNILLDTEMSPKISDFGMARIFGGNQQPENTTRVVGTYGYMSPEYVTRGAFSVKSDTYSFGVLLLEIISGLKIISPQFIMDFPNLIAYAWRLWEEGNAAELVDSPVAENCPLHEVLRCIHVGLLCVQDNPNARPLMSSVVLMFENETMLLPAPKEPAYFAPRSKEIEETRKTMESSLNNMSITTLEVLRRWRYRCNKSSENPSQGYKQVSKYVEIASMCLSESPEKRPYAWNIASMLNELESTNENVNVADESPATGQVLRRWRYRWNKSSENPSQGYKQVSKYVEIASMCLSESPEKRPYAWNIASMLNELESTNENVNVADESPATGQVLRRWRYRWNKSSENPSQGYKQVSKYVEIASMCLSESPEKRPYAWNIASMLNELESMNENVNVADESPATGQIRPYPWEMLEFDMLELIFPFEINKQIPSLLQLTNVTDGYIAFCNEPRGILQYCVEPEKGVMSPQSKCSVMIALQARERAPHSTTCKDDFVIVRCAAVKEGLATEDITKGMFDCRSDKGLML